MKKQYYFLAGFPRSGNTLLSSILNQNEQVYCSPLSPVQHILRNFDENVFKNENTLRLENTDSIDSVGKNIIENYYATIVKPIIIDREKMWADHENLRIIKKYITLNPKIIFTVRPIIEILTSFIDILSETIDRGMKENNWYYKDYLSKNDNRCEYLMRPKGPIDSVITTINEIIKPENKNIFCIINYDDIVYSPQQTMNNVYNFLELPQYNHNFNKIIKLEKDNDRVIGYPENLHEVRPTLKKISKDPKDVLSDYIINKYSNIGWKI